MTDSCLANVPWAELSFKLKVSYISDDQNYAWGYTDLQRDPL